MKTYLITGGAGFIGSHLAEELLERGHKVYSIDNLTTGGMKNILSLQEKYPNRFKHFTKSLEENEDFLSELIDLSDVIFHLAAAVGVKLVVEQPTRTLITNAVCTELVLKHASKKGKRVMIASTSEVYGKNSNEGDILMESGDLLIGTSSKSRWCYAISKLYDEHLALAYNREKDLPVTVIRFFNTVGPRQTGKYGMVIPNFIKAALKNRPITVYGDGTQKRCFTYVKDVVDAIIKLSDEKRAIGEIFNIGSQNEVSIYELAKKIKEKLNSSSEIELIPYERAYAKGFEDMKRRLPSTNKIRELINWEARTNLDEIIDKTAEWFRISKEIEEIS